MKPKISKTFFKYFFKIQMRVIALVSFFIMGFIFLFTFAEQIRKLPSSTMYNILVSIFIAVAKVPNTFCNIAGYVYLASATFSLWNLAQTQQITIMKAIGKSSKQILFPFFSLSILFGSLWVFMFQPACVSLDKYVRVLENIHRGNAHYNVGARDVWSKTNNTNYTIYIEKINNNVAENVYIMDKHRDSITYAETIIINDDIWELKHGYSVKIGSDTQVFSDSSVTPLFTKNDILQLSVDPKKSNIYELIRNIFSNTTRSVSYTNFIISLNKLVVASLSFILFAIIAAVVCLPLSRYKPRTFVAGSVICSAILFSLLGELCESMGNNGTISPILCVWIPLVTFSMLSLGALILKEE